MNLKINKFLIILFIIIFSWEIGYAFGIGNDRTLDLSFVFLFTIFLVLLSLQENRKTILFNIFLVSVACSSLSYLINIPGLRISASEMAILILFSLILLLKLGKFSFINFSKSEQGILIFSALYVLGGFLPYLFTHIGLNHLNYWIHSCVMPSIIFYISFSLISNFRQIEKSMLVACLSMVGFLILTILAFCTEHGEQMRFHGQQGQLTAVVKLGKINYTCWANWIGAMAAMIFPLFFLSSITRLINRYGLFYIFGAILSLYFVYRAGTRGGVLGLGVSIVIIIGLCFYRLKSAGKHLRRVVILSIATVTVASFININISSTVEKKFRDLIYNRTESGTYKYRASLLSDAYSLAFKNPIGTGFNDLWVKYHIDEANFFSWSANGVGLLGVIGFWGVWIMLATSFIRGLFNIDLNKRFYSIVGLSTLVSTSIAANSSDQILHEPQTVLPFWLIMGAAFKALQLHQDQQKFRKEEQQLAH